jgi:mannose-1-phosphate guanylyltransferase
LSDRYAKPAIPWAGTTPLALALGRLKRAGIDDVAVNTHWRAEDVRAIVKANPFGQSIHLSHEPVLLGPGGVYPSLKSWTGDHDLVALNGDIVSAVDVAALLATHRRGKTLATMAILTSTTAGESAVWAKGERVAQIGGQRPAGEAGQPGKSGLWAGTFAGAQVVSPEFVALLPPAGPSHVITDAYLPALARGLPIGAMPYADLWHDIRSPSFYWASLKDLLDRARDSGKRDALVDRLGLKAAWAASRAAMVFMPDSLVASRGIEGDVGPDVVAEPGAVVERGATVRRSVLLAGARVRSGELVEGLILGENLRVPITG